MCVPLATEVNLKFDGISTTYSKDLVLTVKWRAKPGFWNEGSEPGRNPPRAPAALHISFIISWICSPSSFVVLKWNVGWGIPNVSLFVCENVTWFSWRGLTLPNQRKSTMSRVSIFGATSPYEKASRCTWQCHGRLSETGIQHCVHTQNIECDWICTHSSIYMYSVCLENKA